MDANQSAPAKRVTRNLQLYALGFIALLVVGVVLISPTPKTPSALDRTTADINHQLDLQFETLREAQQAARGEAIMAAQQQLIDAGVLPPNDPFLHRDPSVAPLPIGSLTLAGALVALVLTAGLYPVLTAISRNYPDGRHFVRAFSALACIATALHLATNVYSLTIGHPIISPAVQLFVVGVEIPGLLLAITTLVRAPALRPALLDSRVTTAEVAAVPADL
jgi:hypothetical protein